MLFHVEQSPSTLAQSAIKAAHYPKMYLNQRTSGRQPVARGPFGARDVDRLARKSVVRTCGADSCRGAQSLVRFGKLIYKQKNQIRKEVKQNDRH